MNKVYGFDQIEKIQVMQRKLIFQYIAYLLVFVFVIALLCVFLSNNILLTLIFFVLASGFILYSILFWKIKYGILQRHKTFLDNLESGKRDDYVGVFKCKTISNSDEEFNAYVFSSNGKTMSFLVHNQYPICFSKEKKYHIECIGKYIYQWEIIE